MKQRIAFYTILALWTGLTVGARLDSALARTVTDMVGRTVTVPHQAQRLVTTFKPAALCVTALGLQDRLVGIDSDSKNDRLQLAVEPSIARLPAVGQKSTGINFEAMLSVKPDLVIMFAQKDGIAIADRLVEHGVAAIVILPESIDSLYATLELIAGAAGLPERAGRAIGACRHVVDLTTARVADVPADQRKQVYFASPRGVFSTATGDLLQDEIITLAGGVHSGGGLSGYFREISPEQFIAWNPDVVVISGHAAPRTRTVLDQPQFSGVKAIANDSIYGFPSNLAPWDFPSPLSVLGVLWLAEKCYPQQFGDVDLAAEIDQFHKALFGKGFRELGGKIDP